MQQAIRDKVLREVAKVVVGREPETELLLMALLARGHCLLEGVPGVSKTILAKTFSRCLGLTFKRVQFTPDLVPLDIVGGFIFNMKTRDFEFRKGPVFANLLLADEINRAPPKVQSALLEAMQEEQVTVEGHTEPLPNPFMVIATQNPIEFQGVFPLPEGQLDRFIMKINLGYPSAEVEPKILRRNMKRIDLSDVEEVCSSKELLSSIAEVSSVKVSDEILEYLARIASETRNEKRIRLGASPRAMVHLAECSKSRAFLSGRDYVTPDDVKQVLPYVLNHRIQIDQSVTLTDAEVTPSTLLGEIADRVVPPR